MKRKSHHLIQSALWVYIALCIAYFSLLVYQLEWKVLPAQDSTIPVLDTRRLMQTDALLRTRLPQSLGVDYSSPSASLGKAEPFSR